MLIWWPPYYLWYLADSLILTVIITVFYWWKKSVIWKMKCSIGKTSIRKTPAYYRNSMRNRMPWSGWQGSVISWNDPTKTSLSLNDGPFPLPVGTSIEDMNTLSPLQNFIYRIGALLLIAGVMLWQASTRWGIIVYSIGACMFASMQMAQRYDGKNVVLRRLRRQ